MWYAQETYVCDCLETVQHYIMHYEHMEQAWTQYVTAKYYLIVPCQNILEQKGKDRKINYYKPKKHVCDCLETVPHHITMH